MSRGILAFHWQDWRRILGPAGSRQRQRVDEFRQFHPAILYWGDSWFSSPLGENLARQSFAAINGLGMVVGKPGATAGGLFSPPEIRRIGDRVAHNRFDVVAISAGGNDLLSTRLGALFRPWQRGARPVIDADAALQHLLEAGLLDGVRGRYQAMLDRMLAIRAAHPALRVVGHSYARIVRIGVAADLRLDNIGLIALLKEDAGPWLWPPMANVLPDVDEGRRFAGLLIDAFRDRVLADLASSPKYHGFFSYADFTALPEAQDASFWSDEIHPSDAGFALMAERLNQRIREALPAARQAAVG
jgi:lysophospholipase L1-like esterase